MMELLRSQDLRCRQDWSRDQMQLIRIERMVQLILYRLLQGINSEDLLKKLEPNYDYDPGLYQHLYPIVPPLAYRPYRNSDSARTWLEHSPCETEESPPNGINNVD